MLKRKPKEVIFKGEPTDLIWQSPITELSKKATIHVRKDYAVVFLSKGTFLGSFDDSKPTYTVNDVKTPLFKRIFTNTKDDFEIYYINSIVELKNNWGTSNRIPVFDKKHDLHTSIGASGSYKFCIVNPFKLFSKVKGATKHFNQSFLQEFFDAELTTEIRHALATLFSKKGYNLDDLVTITKEEKNVSETVKSMLSPLFEDYGVKLTQFHIQTIAYDQDFLARLSKAEQDRIINAITYDGEAKQRKQELKEQKVLNKIHNISCPNCHKTIDKSVVSCPYCGYEVMS